MKKITTLLMLFMLTSMGAMAQVVTTYNTAGTPLTVDEFKALAGTGKRFALTSNTTSGTGHPNAYDWFGFISNGDANTTLTGDNYLFTLEEAGTDGAYNIKRVSDGKYVSGTKGAFDENNKINFYVKARNCNESTHLVDAPYSISLDETDNPGGNHFNAGPTKMDFRDGTGGWSTYATYGPIYKNVTIKYVNAANPDENVQDAVSGTYVRGGAVTAPEVAGWEVTGDATAEINADGQTITFQYNNVSICNIAYVVKLNGTQIFKSSPVTVNQGTQITALPAEFQNTLFFNYDAVNVTVNADQDIEVNATLKESAPFTPSTSFDDANWYYLNIKGGTGYPTYVEDGNPNVTLPASNADNDNTTWAFIIDNGTYPNFKIMNKAAGSSVILGSESAADDGNEGGSTYATLNAAGEKTYQTWRVAASSEYTNGFYLFNGENIALNHRNAANLAYWTGGQGTGSTFQATKVPENQITYVEALDQLDNSKVYVVRNARGTWNLSGSLTAVSAGDLDEMYANPGTKQVAIVKQNDKYYLYSVTDKKYLTSSNTLYASPLEAVNIVQSTAANGNYKWFFSFDGYTNKNININTNKTPAIVIDGWSAHDEGNTNSIMETAATYSLDEALAAFENYTQCITDYAAFKGIDTNFAEKIGKLGYPKAGTDATTAFTDILARNASGANTADDWNTFMEKFNAVKAADNVKMPEAGNFFRIKTAPAWASKTFSGEQPYLIAENAENGRAAFSKTAGEDVSSIWCWVDYNGTKYLVSYKTGYAVINNSNQLKVGEGEQFLASNGTSVAFKPATNGEMGAFNISFKAGERWLYTHANLYTDAGSGSNDNGYNFTLEEVNELPVTLKKSPKEGDENYYATFYSPVAISAVDGAQVYTVTVESDKYVKRAAATFTGIPAEKGVLLVGTAATATLTIGECEFTGETGLNGVVASEPAASHREANHLFLNQNNGNVGFYKIKENGKTGGFKAYLEWTGSSSAKEGLDLIFDNETTGIDSINNSQLTIDNGTIYNLQGQKVNKAQKGVFIQNGRKVVVK